MVPFHGTMLVFGSVSLFIAFFLKSLQLGGFVLPDYSETYTFYVNADDSARHNASELFIHNSDR